MSDETTVGSRIFATGAGSRVMVDLDDIRNSTGIDEPDEGAMLRAVARTLLAEIDRLSARVEALEHGVYPMEDRVRSLEIDAAWKEGRQ